MGSVVSLPDEIVTEIMSRVPGKALARFRLVSKQFKSLLSDHCFLRLHHNRSLESPFTLTAQKISRPKESCKFSVTNKANGLVVHEFPLACSNLPTRMLSSYHQLLCFVTETGIHLCNPINKESKKLPNTVLSPLCFNESKECLLSFGFIDATQQYKVVKWPHDLEEDRTRRLPSTGFITTWKKVPLKFKVLNIDVLEDGRLKVSRWRRLQRLCPYLLQLASQVHVNGFIYWTTSDFQIVSFSLEDETFLNVDSKPPSFRLDTQGSKKNRFFSLSGSRGNLWMIDYDVPCHIIEIWKMEESRGGEWTKIHKIDLGGLILEKCNVEMLDIQSDQVLFNQSKLIFYDAETNTLEERGVVSGDYQLCHSTDGLLSLQNIS